jgi:hypothetical protein
VAWRLTRHQQGCRVAAHFNGVDRHDAFAWICGTGVPADPMALVSDMHMAERTYVHFAALLAQAQMLSWRMRQADRTPTQLQVMPAGPADRRGDRYARVSAR